tara:strand:- start:350 stop:679 length:330 start_codon:yes stop_codon:yes gene_type:complete
MTNDFFKRWKQHNKILKGGAKATSRRDNWSPICIIDGFPSLKEACQCEWKLKRVKGHKKRVQNVYHHLVNVDKWTSNSPLIKEQSLTIYVTEDYKEFFYDYPTRELEWF